MQSAGGKDTTMAPVPFHLSGMDETVNLFICVRAIELKMYLNMHVITMHAVKTMHMNKENLTYTTTSEQYFLRSTRMIGDKASHIIHHATIRHPDWPAIRSIVFGHLR
jgi:hypothetical protein